MRKSRFSEEQIIHALKEHEAGTKTADISRPLGISDQTSPDGRRSKVARRSLMLGD